MTNMTSPNKEQPIDFHRDPKTNIPICAWCNSVVGCHNPPMNMRGTKQLIDEIFLLPTKKNNQRKGKVPFVDEFIQLYERYEKYHRCHFGLHIPIAKVDAKQFTKWFNRPDVGGFKSYDPVGKLEPLLCQVMERQFEVLHKNEQIFHEKMKRGYETDTQGIYKARNSFVQQIDLVESLQSYFTAKTGRKFVFEVPCQRQSKQCLARRIAANGKNHTHPIKFQRPTIDFEAYGNAAGLTKKVHGMGLSPATGLNKSTGSRCLELQSKITNFHHRQRIAEVAKQNRLFCEKHRKNQKDAVHKHTQAHMVQLLENAMTSVNFDHMVHLVSRGAPADYECKCGRTPLITCTIKTEAKRAKQLVEHGATVDYCNADGMTALMLACKTDNLVMVHTLLDLGSDPCFEGNHGQAAIQIAVRHGRSYVLDVIVDHVNEMHQSKNAAVEAVINHPTHTAGMTPLMICAQHRMQSMARKLLRMGARLDITNHEGKTANEIARQFGWYHLELWLTSQREYNHMKIQRHVDKEEEKNEHLALGKLIHALESQNVEKAVKIVSSGNVPPDYELSCGTTALICASRQGGIESAKQLIKNGCDPSYSNRFGRTPLMEAALSQNSFCLEIAFLFLNYDRTCLNMRDLDGCSALHFASKGECRKLVILLLCGR